MENKNQLPIFFEDVNGKSFTADLTQLDHILMAGSSGQGKTNVINNILLSLIKQKSKDELKLLLIDTNKCQLLDYDALSQSYLRINDTFPFSNVVLNIPDAMKALKHLNELITERLDKLSKQGFKDTKDGYVEYCASHNDMPFIVVVIDDFGDMVSKEAGEFVLLLDEIASLGHRVGIHCIISTQHPTFDVILGFIKSNFPARIAMRVATQMESRLILDEDGAENLNADDEMIVSCFGRIETKQLKMPFITEEQLKQSISNLL